jgi:hypothetical protein
MSPSTASPASMSRSETVATPTTRLLAQRGPRLLADPGRVPARAIVDDVGVAVWFVCLVLLFTGVLPHG